MHKRQKIFGVEAKTALNIEVDLKHPNHQSLQIALNRQNIEELCKRIYRKD
jgi:hypothetical protein